MKFLVLTGTTGFELLENSVIALSNESTKFLVQSKNNILVNSDIQHEKFLSLNDFDLGDYDGIIGHCGAGTTFWALDQNIPYMAVVDLTREDNHQSDLGAWLDSNNYAVVVNSRPLVESDLFNLTNAKLNRFNKECFDFPKLNKFIS